MRYLKTSEAATLLNVNANTLRAWELRFGFPQPQRSPGRHRMYVHCEVAALRDARQEGGSISSAVSRAREALATDNNPLLTAFGDYDRQQADMAMEAALGSRSVERAVEEVLLPTLERVVRERSVDSAVWAFAAPWGADWLRRATQLAPPVWLPLSIFVGNASRDGLDPDALHILALELFCMRAGVKIMSLSARGIAGIRDAFDVHCPDLVVLAGRHLGDETVARWTHSVRFAVGPMPIALYRRGDHLTDMPTTGTIVLPSRATDAHSRLLELVREEHARAAIPASAARKRLDGGFPRPAGYIPPTPNTPGLGSRLHVAGADR